MQSLACEACKVLHETPPASTARLKIPKFGSLIKSSSSGIILKNSHEAEFFYSRSYDP